MGAVVNHPSDDVKENRKGTIQASSSSTAQAPEGHTVTYQLILRHLAKFRDGASALHDILAANVTGLGTTGAAPAVSQAPAIPVEAEAEPKSLLEIRIERHMSKVDQALREITGLNPQCMKILDLAPEVCEQMLIKEWTIGDIVAAELHFWSAAIANSTFDKFDQVEQAWIRRIIRLAKIIGVDAEHKEHLVSLDDWTSHGHA